MKTMKQPRKIVGAEGVYLHTEDGRLIDSISSWWSMIHGYNNKELNNAIKNQVDNLSHVMLGGLTHEPVEKLAKKIKDILPKDLNYSFFSDSGSVAVEVAVKMGIQYYFNLDKKNKKKILALKDSYHGDTFKAMEIGDDSDYHFAFGEKKDVIHIDTDLAELEQIFEKYHEELAAFIVEPLLQGAGGMKMYSVEFLKKARVLCDKYDVLFIYDEVATGFGRTGNMFVADLVCPDIIVLGKALTGGYLGHAVTVANEKVYNGFLSDEQTHALMHGPTFMGNPLACSVALKSIEIFIRDDYMGKVHSIERIMKREMKGFSDNRIKEIRIMGACICIEVWDGKTLDGFEEFAFEKGVFNRPFLKFMYSMVPYIITEEQLIEILNVFKDWFRVVA
jgi:adenosylmethionine-8-amino-7-oxononanoate aminotransferase